MFTLQMYNYLFLNGQGFMLIYLLHIKIISCKTAKTRNFKPIRGNTANNIF